MKHLNVFRLPLSIANLLPAQAFRRLPRAGASPCTPRANRFQAAQYLCPRPTRSHFRQPETIHNMSRVCGFATHR
ncbi:MAG: hypothetical protein ACFNLD_00660 [Kingella oralis]|uniref:hypothetical protein n=1 Tax=Kingella oralis TaxID=505 RepID=UPI0034E5ED7D